MSFWIRPRAHRRKRVKLYVVLGRDLYENFRHVLEDDLTYTMWETQGRRYKYLILLVDRVIKGS